MRFPRTIAVRLILVVTLSVSLIFTVMLGFNYWRSRALLEEQVALGAHHLAMASVNRVEAVLASVAKVTEGLARSLENGQVGDRELHALLRRSVESNPEIFGSAVAYEPGEQGAAGDVKHRQAPYYFRDGDRISISQLGNEYDYWLQDWYQIPRETGVSGWSEPYFDEGGGGTLMATYSVPFYEGAGDERRLKGVVTSDISLGWLSQTIASIKMLQTGYAYLLSRNGTIVTHPVSDNIMNETLFSIAEARGDPAMRELGRRMQRGESGFGAYINYADIRCRLYFSPVPAAGWTLAIVLPEAELFADIRRLTLMVAGMALLGILLIALVVVLIARSITRPLRALAAATEQISGGNFELDLPASAAQDEVGGLSRSFAAMSVALHEHIRQLLATTSAKERIEGELRIAHDIQMAILPKMLPPFPDREEFDLFAVIEPAKAVGGDFYDFFQIDETHLCLVVADVSGKGVPASLFMAVTKTLIKATAKVGRSAAEIIGEVNNEISRDNEQSMFVTVFCGVLDLTSGELAYTNAGHNPPLLIRRGGAPEFFPKSRQLVIGALEGFVYRNESLLLAPGDRLFLYTDGVTEAMNPVEELYSEERLLRTVAGLCPGDLHTAVLEVVNDVKSFAATAPQSDDITVMLVEYRGLPGIAHGLAGSLRFAPSSPADG